MKKIIKDLFKGLLIISLLVVVLSSCSKNGLNAKSTDVAKSFYTEYLKAKNYDDAKKVKSKYMTDILSDELELRSMQIEADAITGVQDFTGMIKKMVVSEGENEDWAKVTFNMKGEEGRAYRIYEANLHFKSVDNKKLMDTLDLTIYDIDEDGDTSQMVYNTKYANKEELTDEDKLEMESIRKYFEDLYEEGYVG